MDPAPEALPDDVAALKAALIAERARSQEVAAELAVARAKASEVDFEELEASATEDELAAEQAARQTLGGEDDDVVRGTQSVGFISFHGDQL